MDISLKQYQSLNISASASFSTAQGRENERRDWTEETYQAKNKQPGNRYDWSRRHLNFEVMSGKKITTRNGKTVYIPPRIVRLGTQRKSLKKRYEQRLKELNFKPWREDAPNQPNTCVDFVLSGDHDRMTEIAFGKPMDFDWQEDNSWVSLADDPNHPGMKMIETMAMDYYDFLCRKFGEENVIGLECHLDETTPHFHALVIPVAERVKRGRVGGYELDPNVESDGKERPEHITTRQFERLKEEEQSFYRLATPKKVLTVSYSHYFGETKYEESQSFRKWHDMLHDEVNCKWGLERGEDTSLMTVEERKEHRKKNKRQLERERLLALEKAEEAEIKAQESEKKALETEKKIDQAAWALDNVESSLAEKRETSSKLNDSIDNARQELNRINKEKESAKNEKTALEQKARELADAVGDPSESVTIKGFCDTVFTYNPKSSGAIIENLKVKGKTKMTMMDVIMAAFQEVDKVKSQKKSIFTNADEFRRQQNNEIKSIMTDMQTILRSFDSAHIEELTRRSRAIVKQELRQNAIAIRKIQQYDEMSRMGITAENAGEIKEKADKSDSLQRVMESLWPGMWDAVQTIVNPRLDKYVMFDKEKETIRKALCKEPEISLANATWMIDAARTIREIVNGTKAEVYEIAAESGVDYLKKLGLDIAEGVVEDVDKVAATTVCLFFGFLDGATTISESCGGGGGNNELPKKKDNEDELSFARRCHQMAKAMHTPRYRLKR
uniref:Plasmid recombination enzyme n=1 Tax=Prevotella sp. Sc00028 TaxID=1231728 RepID=W5QT85_9BACT|nr:plasmid recombination enzyme [Prevotella sp. Sc00028]